MMPVLWRDARGPIQLLATEWAAKNPAEKSSIPKNQPQRGEERQQQAE
jgi:hypothetical protein